MSLTLADYTTTDLILPRLEGTSTTSAIAELCSALSRIGRVNASMALFDAVIRREKLCSSANTNGWALPHARLDDAKELCFAFGRSARPINWLYLGKPVHLVFLFVIPNECGGEYLSVISALARLSQNPGFSQRLMTADDGHSILEVLGRETLKARTSTSRRSHLEVTRSRSK